MSDSNWTCPECGKPAFLGLGFNAPECTNSQCRMSLGVIQRPIDAPPEPGDDVVSGTPMPPGGPRFRLIRLDGDYFWRAMSGSPPWDDIEGLPPDLRLVRLHPARETFEYVAWVWSSHFSPVGECEAIPELKLDVRTNADGLRRLVCIDTAEGA